MCIRHLGLAPRGTHIRVCMCISQTTTQPPSTRTHTYTHIHIHIHYTYTYARARTHTHTYTQTYAHVHTHIHIHIHIHTHTHTYAHIHTPSRPFAVSHRSTPRHPACAKNIFSIFSASEHFLYLFCIRTFSLSFLHWSRTHRGGIMAPEVVEASGVPAPHLRVVLAGACARVCVHV